jgi:hypothetical protein
MAVTFNGEELLIILETGVTEVDIADDLYTEWKTWQRAGSNLMYPQAFRVAGGDAVTSTLDAAGYFFLRNDLGWRIRPAEEDATILFIKNLVPELATLPIAVPTLGGYTVLIVGLQPVTQIVEVPSGLASEHISKETTAAAGSTSTVINTGLTEIDNFYNNMQVIIENSAGIVARTIDKFQQADGAITVSEMPFTPNIGDPVTILKRIGLRVKDRFDPTGLFK